MRLRAAVNATFLTTWRSNAEKYNAQRRRSGARGLGPRRLASVAQQVNDDGAAVRSLPMFEQVKTLPGAER